MAWTRHHAPEDLGRALTGLSDDIIVLPLGAAHLVLGPTGAQVVAIDDGTADAPRAAARLASVVRSALAETVPWTPFVHALLVTDRQDPCPPATRVSPAQLRGAVADGPETLDPELLTRLRAAVSAGALDGLASVAPTARGLPT